MTKNKMYNLLVGGKKAVLLAMFAALPLSNINAVNEQSSEPQTKQTEATENLAKSEDTRGLISVYSVMIFLFGGIAVYFYMWGKETRPNKQKENPDKKSDVQKTNAQNKKDRKMSNKGYIATVKTQTYAEQTFLVLGTYNVSFLPEMSCHVRSYKFLYCVDANGKEKEMQFDVMDNDGQGNTNIAYVERGDQIVVREDGTFVKNLTTEALKSKFIKSR